MENKDIDQMIQLLGAVNINAPAADASKILTEIGRLQGELEKLKVTENEEVEGDNIDKKE